jgi:putative transposase
MPRYVRAKGSVFFFTVVLAQRPSNLLVEEVDRLRRIYQAVQRRHPFETVAICILPDHIHALWALPDGDADFSTRWSLIKSGFSRGLDARARSTSKVAKREKGIWQRRYWEHAIRDDEDFERHVDYIHFNPVKHGHVNRIADWPHSSFHRYVDRPGLGRRSSQHSGLVRRIDGGHASLCPPYEATGSRHDDEPQSPLIIPASIRSRLNLRASAPFLQA